MNTQYTKWVKRFLPLVSIAALMASGEGWADVQLPTAPPATVYALSALTGALTVPTPNSTDPAIKAKFNTLLGLSGLTLNQTTAPKAGKAIVNLRLGSLRTIGKINFVSSRAKPTMIFSLDQKTGALSFSRDLTKYEGDFQSQLPTDDESADNIARKYLKTNGLYPPLSRVDQLLLASVQTVKGSRPTFAGIPINSDNQPMSFDKLKVVTYSRQINGLPVIGPGSKIVVTIGNNGVVEGVIKRWRPFRTLSAPKAIVAVNTVVDPATALAAFSKRLSQQFPRAIPTIQNMDVALYDSNEKAIQPVYVFETNLLTQRQGPGADSSDQFLGVAPALTSAPEPIYQIGDLSGNPTPPANDIQ